MVCTTSLSYLTYQSTLSSDHLNVVEWLEKTLKMLRYQAFIWYKSLHESFYSLNEVNFSTLLHFPPYTLDTCTGFSSASSG